MRFCWQIAGLIGGKYAAHEKKAGFEGDRKQKNAKDGIRTQELLRDQALNLTPLTWLGYLRPSLIHDISPQPRRRP